MSLASGLHVLTACTLNMGNHHVTDIVQQYTVDTFAPSVGQCLGGPRHMTSHNCQYTCLKLKDGEHCDFI